MANGLSPKSKMQKAHINQDMRTKRPPRTLSFHKLYLSLFFKGFRTISGGFFTLFGLHGKDWVDSCDFLAVESQVLMQLSPEKCVYYRQGRRAISQIKSTL